MQKRLRRTKLIQPSLQLRLVGGFFGLAVLGLLLQFILLGHRLGKVAAQVDPGNGELTGAIPGVLIEVLVYTFVVLLPLLFAFGVLFTFRLAGPVYRFERYLAAVARGEQTEPCRIREKDELQSLCEHINVATAPLRERAAAARDTLRPVDEADTAERLAG